MSDRVLEDNGNVAVGATLILHGDADRILPPDATSRRQAKMLAKIIAYIGT